MAIMSFVVDCDQQHVQSVVTQLEKIEELELHGVHNGYQIVAVIDMPSEKMEAFIAGIRAIEYVQTCEVSFLNVEEELEGLE